MMCKMRQRCTIWSHFKMRDDVQDVQDEINDNVQNDIKYTRCIRLYIK